MDSKFISKEIYSGVFVHRLMKSDNQQEFQIENKRFNTLDFTIDFSGSQEIVLNGFSGLLVSNEIPPKKLVSLVTISTPPGSKVVAKFKFNLNPPPPELARSVIEEEAAERVKKLRVASKIFKENPINLTSLSYIHDALDGINFVDPYFPPSDNSIYSGTAFQPDSLVHWRRAQDIFGSNYEVFLDEIEPNDIKQGHLGDCWFMCALASLAERPQLVQRLFVTEKVNPDGIYRVRFCKNGEWVVVTVDDYFPCFPQGNPIYSRSHGNELWVLLLEKAYAKLHGSYMLLRGGWALEGMIDLTGCPTKTYDIESREVEEMIEEDVFWKTLKELDEDGALISASTSGEDRWTESGGPDQSGGLVPGHAYTIIQAKEALGNRLLNIRNPWGYFEWDGDWSDKSPLWTPEIINLLKPVLDENDGTFWMSYQDFINKFKKINVCLVNSYYEARLKGKFIRINIDERSNVISRWYYCVDVQENTVLHIGIHQEDERIFGVHLKRGYLDIGFVVLKRDRGDIPKVFYYQPNTMDRQVEVELQLEPGSYIILPRTTGCKLCRSPHSKSEYIRLITGKHLNPLFESTIKDIFRKFDMRVSGDLNFNEFKALLESVGENLTILEFDQLRRDYCSTQNGITIEGLLNYFKDTILKNGEDKVWTWLNALGYDRDLNSIKSRCFMLTAHSNKPLKMTMRDAVNSNLDKLSTLELLRRYGKKKNDQTEIDLMSLIEPNAGGFTYGVFNNSEDRTLNPKLDCRNVKGALISTMTDIISIDLPPKTGDILAHFTRISDDFDFRVNFSY